MGGMHACGCFLPMSLPKQSRFLSLLGITTLAAEGNCRVIYKGLPPPTSTLNLLEVPKSRALEDQVIKAAASPLQLH